MSIKFVSFDLENNKATIVERHWWEVWGGREVSYFGHYREWREWGVGTLATMAVTDFLEDREAWARRVQADIQKQKEKVAMQQQMNQKQGLYIQGAQLGYTVDEVSCEPVRPLTNRRAAVMATRGRER